MSDCIVSAGNGLWYPRGVDRLERSLIYHGYPDALRLFSSDPKGKHQHPIPEHAPSHKAMPYGLKLTAIELAVREGFTRILWLDASIVCVRNPKDMFDHIGHHGYFLYRSGFNCAQSVSDACLEKFGIDRDTAEGINECASNVVGFDLNNPIGKSFYERWYASSLDGSFQGSRQHDNQSQDPRFLFHRQDQSAASLIAYQLGMHVEDPGRLCCDYNPTMAPSIIFYRQGL